MKLDAGITITTRKIENFPLEMGILEFLRVINSNPRILPNELTIYGFDNLILSIKEPNEVFKTLYFIFQKVPSHLCIQMVISCEIRTIGVNSFIKDAAREIKINPLFKRGLIRGYNPDQLFVTI